MTRREDEIPCAECAREPGRQDRFDDEPPKKTSRRSALRVVSVAAAWSSLVIFAVDLQFGLAELPGWLH